MFKSSTGRLITGGVLANAGIVRMPMERMTSVGAVGTPRRVASAIVLPLRFSTIRSTSVDTSTICRRCNSRRGGGVMRDGGADDDNDDVDEKAETNGSQLSFAIGLPPRSGS